MDFPAVTPPDSRAAAAARARQDILTKPTGALGRLEDLSVWVAACQGHCPPRQFERARVVVFAGDHGVARTGVSAYPPEVTAQMVANIDAGGAAINVLAGIAGATVRVVDIAVDCDEPLTDGDRRTQGPPLQRQHRRRGRADADEVARRARGGPADRRRGGRRRRRPADRRRHGHRKHHGGNGFDRRADRHRAGGGGRPRHRYRRRRLGTQDRGGARRDVPRRAVPVRPGRAAADLRRRGPGRDGRLLRAGGGAAHSPAARRRGRDRGRAGRRPAGAGRAGLVAGRAPVDRAGAHAGAGTTWSLEPIVDLGLRLGEGTGAAVALPLLRAAVATLASMATFEGAGVSETRPD